MIFVIAHRVFVSISYITTQMTTKYSSAMGYYFQGAVPPAPPDSRLWTVHQEEIAEIAE